MCTSNSTTSQDNDNNNNNNTQFLKKKKKALSAFSRIPLNPSVFIGFGDTPLLLRQAHTHTHTDNESPFPKMSRRERAVLIWFKISEHPAIKWDRKKSWWKQWELEKKQKTGSEQSLGKEKSKSGKRNFFLPAVLMSCSCVVGNHTSGLSNREYLID